ncbi:MAG: 30S ribosomal protein S19 [Nanoarchaeota archaeon]|nr:30S ribosomal protein S19 [Nanoarchaeota archaeon]
MAKREFTYHGKKLEELKSMGLNKFMELMPSKERRKLKRGFNESEKILIENLKSKDRVKTHCRDIIIIPDMIGKTIGVFNGKTFEEIIIMQEMLGHRLGEFSITRKKLAHSAPGIGATKSSASASVK